MAKSLKGFQRHLRKGMGGDKKKIARENIIKRHHAAGMKLRGERLNMASCCHNLS